MSMDFSIRRAWHCLGRWVGRRIPTLSKVSQVQLGIATQFCGRTREWLKVLLFLLIAAQFAVWASRLSERRALTFWMRSHPPSDRVFRAAMIGMTEVVDLNKIQKALRPL